MGVENFTPKITGLLMPEMPEAEPVTLRFRATRRMISEKPRVTMAR